MDPRFRHAQSALDSGDVGLLASLLAADPTLATDRSTSSHPTLLQCLVLTRPAVDDLEAMIDLLAAQGSELTAPLVAAAGVDNVRAIGRLLDLGARIEGAPRWSPLEEALYWGNPKAVSLLLDRGAPVANLRAAAALGDLHSLERCFDGRGSLTPAAGAVDWPFGPTVPEADRHDPRQVLGNALVYAAAWGRDDAVETLLVRGAEVNLIPAGFDYAGTPLHYAALRDRHATVDLLLRRGADPTIRDTKVGRLPEDWAAHDGHDELAASLRLARLRAEAGRLA